MDVRYFSDLMASRLTHLWLHEDKRVPMHQRHGNALVSRGLANGYNDPYGPHFHLFEITPKGVRWAIRIKNGETYGNDWT